MEQRLRLSNSAPDLLDIYRTRPDDRHYDLGQQARVRDPSRGCRV